MILTDVMDICKKAMMCDIEIEFAVDVIPDTKGQELMEPQLISIFIRKMKNTLILQQMHILQIGYPAIQTV